MSMTMDPVDRHERDEDNDCEYAPKHITGSHVCSLLFLQLAEHLVQSTASLQHSCLSNIVADEH